MAHRVDTTAFSSAYGRADQDPDSLARHELRPVRLRPELLKPELIQQEEEIPSTIVVFGSARLLVAAHASILHDPASQRGPSRTALRGGAR